MESKVIVVTGASEGIGAALAKIEIARGHRVVVSARRKAELEAVAGSLGPNCAAVVADAAKRGEVERLRDAAIAAFGGVDVWVNNVGRGITRLALEATDDDVDEVFAVNLKTALYGAQAIAPHFRERGAGHLINVSSFLGRVPIAPVRSIYSAAKAALNSLTANLRGEFRAINPSLHVSLIIPGLVATRFGANALHAPANPPAFRSSIPALVPQTAEEVAEVIAGVVENPVAEVYTNPALAQVAANYYQDVAAFEAAMRR